MARRQTVSSTNIREVAWHNKVLYVTFNKGGIYAYEGVSEDEFEGLVSADSVGKHFHAYIKPSFEARQIDTLELRAIFDEA